MVRGFFPQGRNLSLVSNTNYPPQNSSSGSGGIAGDKFQITLPPLGDETYSHYQFCQILPDTVPFDDIETFYPIPVKGSFGPNVFQPVPKPFNLEFTDFTNLTFDFTAQDGQPHGLAISDDGLTLFMSGIFTATIYQYNLTIPNILTAGNVVFSGNSFDTDVELGENFPTGIKIVDNGTKLMIAGNNTSTIYQLDLSTADDLSSAVYNNKFFDHIGDALTVNHMEFSISGTKMFLVTNGEPTDGVLEYPLNTAFELLTTQATTEFFDFTSQATGAVEGISFSDDDKRMFLLDRVLDVMFQYDLTVAASMAAGNVVYNQVNVMVDQVQSIIRGLAFSNDGSEFFIVSDGSNLVYQFNMEEAVDIRVFNDFVDDEVAFDNFDAKKTTDEFTLDAANSAPQGMAWSIDGLTVLISDSVDSLIYQYAATIPRQLSSINTTPVETFNTSTEDGNPLEIMLVDNDTKLLLVGNATDKVYLYNLSTPASIAPSSISVDAGNELDYSGQTPTVRGIEAPPDGLSIILGDVDTNKLIQYFGTQGFKLNTLDTTSPVITDISADIVNIRGIALIKTGNKAGKTLFVLNAQAANSTIEQYDISTAYVLSDSTVSYTGKSFLIGDADAENSTSIVLSPDDTQLFLVDFLADKIFKYENKIRTDTELTFEIVEINPITGDYLLYVNIPQLRDYELIQVLAGKDGAVTFSDPNGTYPPRFKSVKHLVRIETDGTVFESTNQSGDGDVSGRVVEREGLLGRELLFNMGLTDGVIDEPSTTNYPIGEEEKSMSIWATTLTISAAIRIALIYGDTASVNDVSFQRQNTEAILDVQGDIVSQSGIFSATNEYHKLDMTSKFVSGVFKSQLYADGVFLGETNDNGNLINNFSEIGGVDEWRGALRAKQLQNMAKSATTIKIDYDAENDPDTFWHKTPVLITGDDLFLVDNLGNNLITSDGVQTPADFDLPSYQYKDIQTSVIDDTTNIRQVLVFPDETGMLVADHQNERIIEYKLRQKGDITSKELLREIDLSSLSLKPSGLMITKTDADDIKLIIGEDTTGVLFQFSMPNATLTNYNTLNASHDVGQNKTLSYTSIKALLPKSDDYTKMFVIQRLPDRLNEHSMPNPGLLQGVSTSALEFIGISGIAPDPHGVGSKPDGSTFYVLSDTNDNIAQIDTSTNWSMDGATDSTIRSVTLSPAFSDFRSLEFKSDGRKIRIGTHTQFDGVIELTL